MGRRKKEDVVDMIVEEEVVDELKPMEDTEPEVQHKIEFGNGLQVEEQPPDINDPKWTDYVMDELLLKQEKKEGSPTTDGLRRVANILFNNQLSYEIKVHQSTPNFASATSIITTYRGSVPITYCGSAECHEHNTDSPYNKYPLATAETRAEGRALKRLLNLKVLTAEETSKVASIHDIEVEEDVNKPITDIQIRAIERFCKKANVDVKFAIDNLVGVYNSIREVSHPQALQVHASLNEWVNNKDQIPEGSKEFNEGWRSEFDVK